MTVQLLVGDTRERIREIPDGSVDLVACSPPFLALRKYGDNAAEMGSERTPADFLDALLELTGEFRRVLAPHGSIAIELGDTYSGSGGAGGDYNPGGLREGQEKFEGSGYVARQDTKFAKVIKDGHAAGITNLHGKVQGGGNGWPLAKSLTLIPTLYPASLAYGWNMLNPAHTFDRWRVRNVIVWARPNPPVGALGDKVRPATSYITVACTSAKRWFDLDAVRTGVYAHPERIGKPINNGRGATYDEGVASSWSNKPDFMVEDRGGAPPLDWWEDDDPTGHATLILPTQPYPGAHYATWPETLAARLIKMMCPLRVCTTCGEPSRRITGFDPTQQPRLAAHIKERRQAMGITLAEVNGWFGYKEIAKNWERTDPSGARIPTADDWKVLRQRLDLSDEFSELISRYDATVYFSHGDSLKQQAEPRVLAAPLGVNPSAQAMQHGRATKLPVTLGWSDCGHDTWRPGRVLDPFAGSGTTLAVAQGLGRDAIGIELYEANAHLVRERVGMFLSVDEGAA